MTERDIIIGIDAGTSVIKAVAFGLSGKQLGEASVPNRYDSGANGAATQGMDRTWADCAYAIQSLGEKISDLPKRTAALAVTAQGDGTWLVGRNNRPVADAWLWLDARAAETTRDLASKDIDVERFLATGTALNTCQQGAQMAHMHRHCADLLDRAESAMHCKDWLYLNLTGVRATDPSEASFTFGDFRTRRYSDLVIDALELKSRSHLLPDILDGSHQTHPLTAQAASETGLLAGTPVSLGYVDMVMTALGAGVYTGTPGAACSTIGSTGVHMRAVRDSDINLRGNSGYVICLPADHMVTQVQTNMAATLNIDWALRMAADLMSETGHPHDYADLVARIDGWLARSEPGQILYHPYISEAGERGPIVNANARAGFIGLSSGHRFPDLIRAVVESLGMAARDCYGAMDQLPLELRLTGGAARSRALRSILAASIGAPVRVSAREEAGAAGCAMMAAVAIGAYPDMESCVSEWVTPLLGDAEAPEPDLQVTYSKLYPAYAQARQSLEPVWDRLADHREGADAKDDASKSTQGGS
ncbi:MAG TPA: carbohydrate kinase [Thalassospira sp.]|uniref:FGGY-family carbohydrate kinase n=3 Tax=unclassified Thalassospira TaxID=2648997 RepID=UPI000EF0353C|nr:FGGY-family carbohydrate kinase [Thalassospira sp. UBA848]HAI30467.1 carbohydrate kinase [Thalassospira sp.]|tara:strand:+ start:3746 stop:5344 length:1599 start_codon:yes stop_codon:yes gene_type:complete